jgi:hypothetical protein
VTIVPLSVSQLTPTKRKIINNSSVFEKLGFLFRVREGSSGALNVHLGDL